MYFQESFPNASWQINRGTWTERCSYGRREEVHGNFLVNERQASAEEFLALIAHVQEVAMRERGVELHTEVQIVGEQKSLHEVN